jgi:hypothetical protein
MRWPGRTGGGSAPARQISTMLTTMLGVFAALAMSSHDPSLEGRDSWMWTWASEPILTDSAERVAFLDFCTRHQIRESAMQIQVGEGRLLHTDAWRALLALAHQRGIRIHALDGDPTFARPDQYETVLARVQAVVAYNASAAPADRFDGIHLDIEPYLLPEWQGLESRERLLTGYLRLHERAAARARAAGLAYEVDVPFWFQSIDAATGEAIGAVTYRGERRSVMEHLLAMVDEVTIMAYRIRADGPNGIVAITRATVESADRIGRAHVVIGVETEAVSPGVPPEVTFATRSPRELSDALTQVYAAYGEDHAFAGVAIHQYVTFRQLLKE